MKTKPTIGLLFLIGVLALLLGACSGGDTTSLSKHYLKASNTDTGDEFGFSVAFSDDGSTIAIGARYEKGDGSAESNNDIAEAGAVYIFVKGTSGWAQQKYIKAPMPIDADGDQFGFSVALSADGNTLAVGAIKDDTAFVDAGAVYIFTRSEGVWTQQQKITAGNTQAGDWFGYSVALSDDGTVLAVGAPLEDTTNTDSGSAYVYRATTGDWSIGADTEDTLKAVTPVANDKLGISVALNSDGNVLAAGAVQTTPAIGSGAVTVFTPDGGTWLGDAGSTTVWRETVTATVGDDQDQFGVSVALDSTGTVLAVGAWNEDSNSVNVDTNNGAPDAGAAYVFVASGGWLDGTTVIDSENYIKGLSPVAGDNFGYSVSLSSDGNTLAVGAPALLAGTTGSVYKLSNGGAWGGSGGISSEKIIIPGNGDIGDQFGISVVLTADATRLIVGANREDSAATGMDDDEINNAATDSGAAYLWKLDYFL